ncbi:hypothetical protein HOG16_02920 [Candidatus Woesearchaeota archaeon]|jgi:hypothetical protein|nr:hypothetical protein [Candidatus Woesearchaeota archaeon]MBT4322304.1 hypothetical protein [Candidatus Woesearchaeota archaeon]MBT4630797.1 hypothetical protein [Candidatus Woesearchaeota archaeon]
MKKYEAKPDFIFRNKLNMVFLGGGLTFLTVLATFELFSQGCSQTEILENLTISQQTEIDNQITYQDSTRTYQ